LRSSEKRILYIAVCLLSLISLTIGQSNKDDTEKIDLTKGVIFEITPHTGFMGSSGIFGIKMGMHYSVVAFEFADE
jgi:hypothetical protein